MARLRIKLKIYQYTTYTLLAAEWSHARRELYGSGVPEGTTHALRCTNARCRGLVQFLRGVPVGVTTGLAVKMCPACGQQVKMDFDGRRYSPDAVVSFVDDMTSYLARSKPSALRRRGKKSNGR